MIKMVEYEWVINKKLMLIFYLCIAMSVALIRQIFPSLPVWMQVAITICSTGIAVILYMKMPDSVRLHGIIFS